MHQINIHEAKAQLSRLLEEVESGEEVVIARAGKPVARLVKYEEPAGRRQPGGWKGQVWLAPDFDDIPPEIIEAFHDDTE
jgi:prevent-host-death family protein